MENPTHFISVRGGNYRAVASCTERNDFFCHLMSHLFLSFISGHMNETCENKILA